MTKPIPNIYRLIDELCPEGVEFKTLGEIGTLVRGSGLQKKDFVEEGVGCIHYGQIYTYYGAFADRTKSFVSEELAKRLKKAQKGDVLIAGVSENIEDVCKALGWLGDEICISGDMFAFRHNQNTKFITYILQTIDFQKYKEKYAQGAKVTRVKSDKILAYKIPIPPLPVQEAIVDILDTFITLEAELEAELEARRKQYEYYRDELLTFGEDVEWKTLGEIANYRRGSFPQPYGKPEWYGGENAMPFVQVYDVGEDMRLIEDTKKKISIKAQPKSVFVAKGTVIVTLQGSIGRVAITQYDSYLDRTLAIFEGYKIDVNKKYFAYQLQRKFGVEKKLARGSTIKTITKEELTKFQIPIPPLAEQEHIVATLDKFDALVNDLSIGLPAEIKARRQQYEYYRDKLLTFPEKACV